MALGPRLIRALLRPRFPRDLGWFEVLLYPSTGTLEWMRRHALLIGELERFRAGRETIEVLDFGGAGGALVKALRLYGRERHYRVITADIDPVAELVIQSDGSLPIDSVDVVVSSDVFEHIPPDARAHWAAELTRVARLGQAHTFPADGMNGTWASTWADQKLDAWHGREFGVPERWTAEHLAGVEPTIEEMLELFPDAEVRGFANVNIWLAMLRDQLCRRDGPARLRFALRYLTKMRRRDGGPPWKGALLSKPSRPG